MTTEQENDSLSNALAGQVVAVPESRQLDILEQLLVKRGAVVRRVPLVSILDAPDPVPVLAWMRAFIANPPDYLVVLTGEGLRRLQALAQRNDIEAPFIAALASVITVCRGPKPGRTLKEFGLKPGLLGKTPTTPGIIETLDELSLEAKRVAVQLYGEEPNRLLIDYLQERGAHVLAVAPYIYAPNSDEGKVLALINDLVAGRITMMCFTSQPQYKRLVDVAKRHQCETLLREGLQKVSIAAVGPIVAEQLQQAGVSVSVMPESSFFMKPMVTELVKLARANN
ncbi:MAG: uroporphyrinogen-III synthase [Gammaproteobacteria bacterium]